MLAEPGEAGAAPPPEHHDEVEEIQDGDAEQQAGQEAEEARDTLSRAASFLESHFRPKGTVDYGALCCEAGLARKDLEINLAAAAMMAMERQEAVRDGIAAWIEQQAHLGAVRPLMYLEHLMYDETPMLLNVTWAGARECATNKILVVQTQWIMLIFVESTSFDEHDANAPAGNYLCLRGSFSPALRSLDSTTGEGLKAAVLSSCQPAPNVSIFPLRVRLAELDEYGANLRCEGLVTSGRQETWGRGVFLCAGHKAHASAEKTWLLPPIPSLITGVVHLALFLQTPQALTKLRRSLEEELEHRPLEILLYQKCPGEANKHRHHLLQLFSPAARQQPRRRAFLDYVADAVLNGDWTLTDRLQHFCRGPRCCKDAGETKKKVQYVLSRLLVVLAPTIFKKNNWLDWMKGLRAPGLIEAMHSLLSSAFMRAFGGHHPGPEDGADIFALAGLNPLGNPPLVLGDQDPAAADAEQKRKESKCTCQRLWSCSGRRVGTMTWSPWLHACNLKELSCPRSWRKGLLIQNVNSKCLGQRRARDNILCCRCFGVRCWTP